jgi:hypothetical protein
MAQKEFKFMSHILIRKIAQIGNECEGCFFKCGRRKTGCCQIVYWAKHIQKNKRITFDKYPCFVKGHSYIFIKIK